jgi:trigger factor
MSYSVQNLNSCTKKILFTFDKLDLSTEIKSAIVRKQKNVNVKGFRKGKAPLAMVEKMYGPQVELDALNSFVQNKLYEAVTTENMKVVGHPTFENMKYDKGRSVSFDAVVEVFPEITLKPYAKLEFTQKKVEITDEDLKRVEENYLGNKAEIVEVKDKAAALAKGQFGVINFAGEMPDGSKPDNMKAEEFMLEIGSSQFIPGFEDGVIGMKAGDEKILQLTFPNDYHMDSLRGVLVKFSVSLKEIKEKKLPAFTEEFAKEVGYESIADFKAKNRDMLLKQRTRANEQDLHQQILERLVKDNHYDVPQAMITQQEKHLKEDLEKTLKSQGFNEQMMEEYFKKWSTDMTQKAEFQVRSGLILDTLGRDFKIEPNEEDFKAKLKEMALTSKIDVDKLEQYYTSNENLKKNMFYALREEQTFAKLKEKLTIKFA